MARLTRDKFENADVREPLYQTLDGRKSIFRNSAPGWLASFLVHVLFALLFLTLASSATRQQEMLVHLVSVNVVQLGENTVSPPQQQKSTVPQQKTATQKIVRHSAPVLTAPARNLTIPDALGAQLRALARLREPQTHLPVLDNAGASNVDATSDDAVSGPNASYSVRDYIRNQVERRWSVNFSRLGDHHYIVLLRIALKANGAITKAEIVDRARFADDAAYHDVALSARNAALLSSPIALPTGQLEAPITITLRLNARDTLR